MKQSDPENRIKNGAFWLIRLRWLAAAGIVVLTLTIKHFTSVVLQEFPLYLTASVLLILNFCYLILLKRTDNSDSKNKWDKIYFIVNFQIVADLMLLTFLLHFSGGIENPLIAFYIFHMIIAGILLSRKKSIIHMSIALSLIIAMALLEYFDLIQHNKLKGLIDHEFYKNPNYLIGVGFVFVSTSFLIVYVTTHISEKLKEHDKALWIANIELNVKDKIKNEYILRLTHDMKGHLAAIQNLLDVVKYSEENDERFDFAMRAHERVKKLTNFVAELLRLTRMRLTDNLEMKNFSFKDLVTKSIDLRSENAKGKNITINLKYNSSVDEIYGDYLSLNEAIQNLIENAIKYSPNGGTVDIEVKNDNKYLIVEISDTGIGIPKDEIHHVFHELYRASNAKELTHEGIGIGLALVKQIIERHKGTISIESEVNKGTKIKIKLPICNTVHSN